ncbi:putative alcohol dehydrogenase [Aureobasidium pullulans]|nr:putative alcohol dehydrogenase [Aureobasidium pullulans]
MIARTNDIPLTQKAIIAGPDRNFTVVHDAPVIDLAPNAILVKVHAVALNPVDTKLTGDFVTPGAIFGFDCAGTVVAVGSAVRKRWVIGERVCGSACGMDPERPSGGAFAEYTALPGELALRIPDYMSFEDAATLPTALNTTVLAVFWSMNIPMSLIDKPAEKSFPILVYGGSTSVGTMVIQMLKRPDEADFLRRAGLRPITTCSPKNFDFVKSFGAEAVFDYRSPSCGTDIKKYTKNGLGYAIDCITEESSMKICYAAIGRAGGRYIGMDPFPAHVAATRKIVKSDWVVAFRITGMPCNWPAPFTSDADPELSGSAIPFFDSVEKLLADGQIKTHPAKVSGGGLEAVIGGVDLLRRKEISAEKLVYTTISEK